MAKQDHLDPQTRDLVRFAATITQGYEPELRERIGSLRSSQVPAAWVEELLLQSILMVGYLPGARTHGCTRAELLVERPDHVTRFPRGVSGSKHADGIGATKRPNHRGGIGNVAPRDQML